MSPSENLVSSEGNGLAKSTREVVEGAGGRVAARCRTFSLRLYRLLFRLPHLPAGSLLPVQSNTYGDIIQRLFNDVASIPALASHWRTSEAMAWGDERSFSRLP